MAPYRKNRIEVLKKCVYSYIYHAKVVNKNENLYAQIILRKNLLLLLISSKLTNNLLSYSNQLTPITLSVK